MERLYLWTAEAIIWALERGLERERPDLLLLYYPSRLPFYWMLARWHALLGTLRELPAGAGSSREGRARAWQRPLGAAAAAADEDSGRPRMALVRLPGGAEASVPRALLEVRAALGQALRHNVTDAILETRSSSSRGRGRSSSSGSSSGGGGGPSPRGLQQPALEVSFEEWLGNADLDLFGRPSSRHEDRTFSTALAVNALIDIWAVEAEAEVERGRGGRRPASSGGGRPQQAADKRSGPAGAQPAAMSRRLASGAARRGQPRHRQRLPKAAGQPAVELRWQQGAPDAVIQAARGGYSYLLGQAHAFPASNAFFSLSIKSEADLPAIYPTNFMCSLYNHSSCIGCDGPASELARVGFSSREAVVAGVRGLMGRGEFEQKLAGRCFGRGVPKVDLGRNCQGCLFPHWASEPLTWALRALALLKVQLLSW
jgi:hypothetical protein